MDDLLRKFSEFKGMQYPQICDELTKRAQAYLDERYDTIRSLEDERDRECYSLRFEIGSPINP